MLQAVQKRHSDFFKKIIASFKSLYSHPIRVPTVIKAEKIINENKQHILIVAKSPAKYLIIYSSKTIMHSE